MSLDQAQREQALSLAQSFIVQAPAGSGKTELLTQRFLALLSTVQEPEEILAITFTKKAASEMRSRIRDALIRAQEEPLPDTAHGQKTWQLAKRALTQDQHRGWGLLANPNRLRIKTIDAFNSLLTRQLPLLSHFGAPPDIIEHPQLLYREAVQTFLAQLEEKQEWSKPIAQLLLHLDNNMKQAETLLIEMLGKRDQWLPHIMAHQNHPTLRRMLEKNLGEVIQDSLLELKTLFPQACIPELLALLQYAGSNLKTSKPDSPILSAMELSALPGTSAAALPAWLGIAQFLLTADKTWRKKVDITIGFPPSAKAFKQRMDELLESLGSHEKLRHALGELSFLPKPGYTDEQWEILKALHEVLKIVVAQLTVIFRLSGKIDYTENAQAALFALGTEEAPTDLALVLDYQIKHLLVDEFQDTSNNQFRLLEKLVHGWQPGDGRTLFLVGDPMQSIYRFREAEVGLFIRAREQGIGPLRLTALTLSVNFRSKASLVDWINAHFNKVLPPFDDIESGAISYTPSTVLRENPDLKTPEAETVQLHAFVDSPPFAQADKIVQLVQQSLKEQPQAQLAILVRSRRHLRTLIPALKKAQLDYQAVEIDPLTKRPLIQDLLALTRALLCPADRIAWLSLLRSPCCGLSLHDLLLLAGNERKELIWQRLQNTELLLTLSADGQERLERLLPVLKTTLQERHRDDLELWIEKTWILLGGPACIENEAELKDARLFFELLKKISLNGNGLLSGLQWETLHEAIEKLYAQSQASSQLQIMTIHNAKGLEFDTVILPHLEKGTVAKDKPLLTWLERPRPNQDSALVLAPIHAVDEEADNTYNHIRQQDNNKTKHENGRLLYVAATRAKKTLHLLLSLKTSSKGEVLSPPEGSMLKKLWPVIQDKIAFSACAETGFSAKAQQTPKLKRLVTAWKNPLANPSVPERPPHNKIQGFHLEQKDAQALGIVVHRILQALGQGGLSRWQSKPREQQSAYIKMLLLQNGILPSLMDKALAKVKLAIQNTLTDPRGLWILEQADAQSELALTAILGQKPQMLIIDRTFVDESNRRWIIDYKTSAPEGQELTSFLAQEKAAYAKQMRHYSLALQKFDSRPIHLGLYFPLLPAWQEWTS